MAFGCIAVRQVFLLSLSKSGCLKVMKVAITADRVIQGMTFTISAGGDENETTVGEQVEDDKRPE